MLERLWQLYLHDLSEFRGSTPDEQGDFSRRRLTPYFDETDRRAYLVYLDARPVGFAMVTGLGQGTKGMGEFFVVRGVRRGGIGRWVALQLLSRHPGRWEIAFQEENPGAARFWRGVAPLVAGERWSEVRRPVPGKPEVPPDVWITLDTRVMAPRLRSPS